MLSSKAIERVICCSACKVTRHVSSYMKQFFQPDQLCWLREVIKYFFVGFEFSPQVPIQHLIYHVDDVN